MEWEYSAVETSYDFRAVNLEDRERQLEIVRLKLNEKGHDGWELVSVIPHPNERAPSIVHLLAIYKRAAEAG